MILFINTNSKDLIKFFITDSFGSVLYSLKKEIDFKDSQKILNILDNFLVESKIDIQKKPFSNIVICNGPGINMNFRIGIIITNALSFVVDAPVSGVLSSEFDTDDDFINIGLNKIKNKDYNDIILPEYSISTNK